MLKNGLTEAFGIEHPSVSGGMLEVDAARGSNSTCSSS